jgi:small-conductance mechanosensitive channel
MACKTLISKLILTIIILGFLCADQPIEAASPLMSETIGNQKTAPENDSKDLTGGQLSQDEIDSIAAALPEGEVRQMFNKKFATAADKDNAASDEKPISGEEMMIFFYDGEKAFSRVQEQIRLFVTNPTSTINSRELTATLENLHEGKGFSHLILTFFIVALLILGGLAVERLVRRSTENLRSQILESPLLGRLQFLRRVVSRLLLNLLGLGAYMLTTFVLFALFYDEGDPGFIIVSMTLIVSYYIRCAILAAKLVLSPVVPAMRLFPMQDEDAKFLYRWFIRISVTMMVIGASSYIFRGVGGISQERFEMIYMIAGMSIVVLVAVMIWRSRRRVSRAIWPGDPARDETKPSLRARIAKSWHWFAMLYVIGMGVYWVIKGLADERGALIPLLISIFLIPIFIGLSQWAEHLLNIASGISPTPYSPQDTGSPEATSDSEAIQLTQTDDQKADTKSYLQQHLPLIKRVLRIILAALMFFLILRLWGIDLPVGRMFTATAMNIIGLLLFGFVVWQYTKTRIDRRLREEMPDQDEEMEEGGSGGSRIGTLLVLLRKFVLSVLFVLVGLIFLASIGIDIGPLIAGAGVIGLAIGFGAQTLVKDIIAGVFFLMDDAFRVGDFIETSGTKGMVEHISLRSLRLRNARGPVHTIPFGDMGTVTNMSRDYIITKLDFRVRYDTDVDKVRKVIKKIYQEIEQDEELGIKLLGKIKSQGVKQLDDSAMIMRVKYKTKPGDQFIIRKELYRMIQESFRKNGIEFAHRNVTVYMPSGDETAAPDKKAVEAGAAAALAGAQAEEAKEKPKEQ